MLRGRLVRHPGGDTGDRSVWLRNDDQIGPAIRELPEDEHHLAASRMKRIMDPSLDWLLAGSMCLFRAKPGSAGYPCRPRADGSRRNDAANEARPPCAAPRPSPRP